MAAEADHGAAVLVQDYHLALLGALLAKARPDLRTVHFSHTPFADPNVLRALPSTAAGELLAGMAGFGACGFHTARWEAAFRAGYADPELATYAGGVDAPTTFVAPLGPDPAAIAEEAGIAGRGRRPPRPRPDGRRPAAGACGSTGSSSPRTCCAGSGPIEELLETRPEWRGRVVMLALAYPSREGLADYLAYRTEVEHTVDPDQRRLGQRGLDPDRPRRRRRPGPARWPLSARYDVLLVNPVRDGLNLVAKEGPLVNTTDGVVVLSREAGAWEELSRPPCGVNPFDVTGTARALELALSMDGAERATRAAGLRQIVLGRTAADWLADQLAVAGRLC